ncbi:hypothetical protein MBLNU457_3268t1 [Dothideomycetes sp. NU457]
MEHRLPDPFALLDEIRADLAPYGDKVNVRHVHNLLNEIPENHPLRIHKPLQMKSHQGTRLKRLQKQRDDSDDEDDEAPKVKDAMVTGDSYSDVDTDGDFRMPDVVNEDTSGASNLATAMTSGLHIQLPETPNSSIRPSIKPSSHNQAWDLGEVFKKVLSNHGDQLPETKTPSTRPSIEPTSHYQAWDFGEVFKKVLLNHSDQLPVTTTSSAQPSIEPMFNDEAWDFGEAFEEVLSDHGDQQAEENQNVDSAQSEAILMSSPAPSASSLSGENDEQLSLHSVNENDSLYYLTPQKLKPPVPIVTTQQPSRQPPSPIDTQAASLTH